MVNNFHKYQTISMPFDRIVCATVLDIIIYHNKKAQLWLRNPREATAFQIHPEEIHRN